MTDKRLDDKLAQMTDAYLAKRSVMEDEALSGEWKVVELLHETIEPQAGLSPEAKKRLEYRLGQEWDRHYGAGGGASNVIEWGSRRMMLRLAAILVTGLVLVTLLLTLFDSAISNDGAQGTAVGEFPVRVIGVAVVGLVVVLIFVWRQRR